MAVDKNCLDKKKSCLTFSVLSYNFMVKGPNKSTLQYVNGGIFEVSDGNLHISCSSFLRLLHVTQW